jgi:hypothetical protein
MVVAVPIEEMWDCTESSEQRWMQTALASVCVIAYSPPPPPSQTPSTQKVPHGQTLPQRPQLLLSQLRSAPPQAESQHCPHEQYGVDAPQTLPQAPQFSGSLFRKVQNPSQ